MASATLATLLESVAAANQACTTARYTVQELVRASEDVDESVETLDSDLQALDTVLQDQESTFSKVSEFPSWVESARDKEVWSAVRSSIAGCIAELDALVKLVTEVRGDEDVDGWLSSTMRAARLGVSRDELYDHSTKIQDYVVDFQMARAMVNLSVGAHPGS